MKEEQVKEILGSPDSEEGGGLMELCLAWFEGEQTIAVDFDFDGKAIEKRFRPSPHLWWVHERARKSP